MIPHAYSDKDICRVLSLISGIEDEEEKLTSTGFQSNKLILKDETSATVVI